MALEGHNIEELVRQAMTTQASYEESRNALQLLSDCLQGERTSWPTLDLIRCQAKLSRQLREANPFEDSTDPDTLAADAAQQIKQTYSCLANFIPNKTGPALYPTNTEKYISHDYLREFASQFALPVQSREGGPKPVISIALPNGPLLAAVCIAVITQYTAAPINPAAGPQQFEADVLQAGAKCILTTREDYAKLELEGGWTQENDIQVLFVDLTDDMKISITTPSGAPISAESSTTPNTADDIALILFTSGTSGKKKVVPITTHSIVAGVTFVIDSWALTAEDVCLNMMPLYHV